MQAFSIPSLAAAAFGTLMALVTYEVICFGESGGSTMCPDGEPTTTLSAQLVVRLVGLVPALAMVFFAFRDAKRPVVAALAVGLALWAGLARPEPAT